METQHRARHAAAVGEEEDDDEHADLGRRLVDSRHELQNALQDLAGFAGAEAVAAQLSAALADVDKQLAALDGAAEGRAVLRERPSDAAAGPSREHEEAYEGLDFAALAERDARLSPYVDGRGRIDFADRDACVALSRAIFRVRHGVEWELPERCLAPGLPGRMAYLRWVEALLAVDAPADGGGLVSGVDVGTGASAVYALLGAAAFGWRVVGTDVTPVALEGARANVARNPHVAHLLEVRDASRAGGVLEGVIADGERFAFCVCNPPFFASAAEAERTRPDTDCGGTAAELWCEGGELAFTRRMVAESARLPRDAVHWYTTLCGKKATKKALVAELHGLGVAALRTATFSPGKTVRWAVAWSFAARPDAAARPLAPASRPLPPCAAWTHTVRGRDAAATLGALERALSGAGATVSRRDPAAFSLAGSAPVPPAGAGAKRGRAEEEAGGQKGGGAFEWRAEVLQEGPGRLLLRCTLRGRRTPAAERGLGALAGALRASLTNP